MLKKNCPKCQSREMAYSRIRNVRERFAKSLGNRPYRCLSCGWRGYFRGPGGLLKEVLAYVLVLGAVIWIVFATYYIFEDSLQEYAARINKKAFAKPKPKPKPKPEQPAKPPWELH